MSKKNKIIGIGRVVIRNKIIRKIGLDTDICFNWINEDYSEHQPNIVNKQNRLFINYKVFGELIGNQIGDDDVDEEGVNEIRNQIFKFMRENRINLLKKSELNQNEINKMFLDLKKKN